MTEQEILDAYHNARDASLAQLAVEKTDLPARSHFERQLLADRRYYRRLLAAVQVALDEVR
jgi:hypothetical protein